MKSGIKVFFPILIFGIFAAVFFFIPLLSSVLSAPTNPYLYGEADDGIVFHSMHVDIEWHDDRSCHIEHRIDMEFLDNGYFGRGSHGIYVDIPVNSGEMIRNIEVDMTGNYGSSVESLPYYIGHENVFALVRVTVGDSDRTFGKGGKISGTITYDYITPVHPEGKDLLDINPIGYGWTSKIEQAVIKVTYPTKPEGVTVTTGDYYSVRSKDVSNTVSVGNDGKTFTVTVNGIDAYNGVRVKTKMPEGALKNYSFISEMWLTIVVGVALLAVTVLMMVLFGRDKPLTPVVDFYPPRIDGMNGQKRHMLPVQMGKLIDGTCSSRDITSLIFYWASEGYISIEEDENGKDTEFVKLKRLDAVTQYEKQLFSKLFSSGKKDENGKRRVKLSALKGKFAESLNAAKTSVDTEYSDSKLYQKRNTVLSVFVAALCALYGIAVAGLCTFRIHYGMFNFLGLVTLFPVAVAAGFGTLLVRYYAKFSVFIRRALLGVLFAGTALFAVGVMFLVPSDAMCWAEKALFAVLLGVSSAIAPFLTRRTEFYTEQLNSILGFRDFIRDAEKDRLELLLKDDPQYYYNILPYANVLGVSSIWSSKFKDLAIEPPSYYHGRGINAFDIMVMHSLCSSVGSSLSYTPPSASGGSYSGGGGGGGGGGFGGGGGGRW